MKRALLAGLMLAQGWAGACSPVPPSAAFLKANKQLLALKPGTCTAPQMPRSQTWCRVYTARPSQVIPLLATMYSAKIKRNGDDWTLNAEADRVVVQVQATNAGTRVVSQRLIPVKERLGMALWGVLAGQPQDFWPQLKRLFAPPTCQNLGITDTAWYGIERCRVVPHRSEPNGTPSIEISLRSAVDRTVPLHQIKRFGPSPNPCTMYDFF